MTLTLEWKKKLVTKSDRVKAVDIHPTETWVLSALYNGQLAIHDYATQALVKSIGVSSLPLRSAKFITRQNWVACAGDDLYLRVYDYVTLDKVASFEAHSDYIRSVAVHPSLPLILTSSDDLTIKLWDWERDWQKVQSFEGHTHYVMMVAWSPRDLLIFASGSLDRSIRVWSAAAPGAAAPPVVEASDFTLRGHEKGVCSVEYSTSRDKPYLLSASDDSTVRVWDYQTRQCLQVLTGIADTPCHAVFHPYLPIILCGSESGEIRIWHSSTYRNEGVYKYDMGRVWALGTLKASNDLAVATDEGTLIVSLGSDKPVASMHQGKIVLIRENDIFSTNVRLADEMSTTDGEKVSLPMKEIGSSPVFPQTISHSPNGRFVAICGDGEYSVLTSQALRNKAYGEAVDLAWSLDGAFAVRTVQGRIKVFVDFNELHNFTPAFDVREMYGGHLIGLRGDDFVCFYDWSSSRLVRRVECAANGVYWSDSGQNVAVTAKDEFYILNYDAGVVSAAISAGAPEDDEGLPSAFEVSLECPESVDSALWVDECFVFVTATLRLQTFVGGQAEAIGFLQRKQFLLGYVDETSRCYLVDRDGNITSYRLDLPFLQFQSCLIRNEMEAARSLLEQVPRSLYERVARFLAHRGYMELAIQYTDDLDYKVELGMVLGKLSETAKYIEDMGKEVAPKHIQTLWKSLGDAALAEGDFTEAKNAYLKGKDYSGLFLLATSLADESLLQLVSEEATKTGMKNIAFLSKLLLHDIEGCTDLLLKENRIAEALMLSRAYRPSGVPELCHLWKNDVNKTNTRFANRIIIPDPETNVDYKAQLEIEAEFKLLESRCTMAPTDYTNWQEFAAFDLVEEWKDLGPDVVRQAIWDLVAGQNKNQEPAPHTVLETPVSDTMLNETVVDSEQIVLEEDFQIDDGISSGEIKSGGACASPSSSGTDDERQNPEAPPRPWSQLTSELRQVEPPDSADQPKPLSGWKQFTSFLFGGADDKDYNDRVALEQWLSNKRVTSGSSFSKRSVTINNKNYEPLPKDIIGSSKRIAVLTSFERRERIRLYNRTLAQNKPFILKDPHMPNIWARLESQRASLGELNRKALPIRQVGSTPPIFQHPLN